MYNIRRANSFARKKNKIKFKRYIVSISAFSSLLFIIIAISVLYISKLERFTISDIRILGNEVIDSSDIENIVHDELNGKYLWLFPKTSVFLYPSNNIMDSILDRWMRVSSVDIYADTMTSLTVRLNERKPAYVWCAQKSKPLNDIDDEECYFLDKKGLIFAKAPYFSGPVFLKTYGPVVDVGSYKDTGTEYIGKRFLEKKEFDKIIILKESLNAIGMKAVKFEVLGEDTYQFAIEDGTKIILKKDDNVETVLDNLDSVLEFLSDRKKIDYIDLRFGNKVFYKLAE